jgi:hypothetical protein
MTGFDAHGAAVGVQVEEVVAEHHIAVIAYDFDAASIGLGCYCDGIAVDRQPQLRINKAEVLGCAVPARQSTLSTSGAMTA